ASFLIVLVFCGAGKLIFALFGITLPAFRITGGVLVALVRFPMLRGRAQSSVHPPSDEDLEKTPDAGLDVAVTPLAMPILAGPGTIATAMNYASTGSPRDFAVTVSAVLVLSRVASS